ncbi:MAG: chemotaxis protein CheD [Pararobbsia sp.]
MSAPESGARDAGNRLPTAEDRLGRPTDAERRGADRGGEGIGGRGPAAEGLAAPRRIDRAAAEGRGADRGGEGIGGPGLAAGGLAMPGRIDRPADVEVVVRIGEAKAASHGVLKATLGSCVGIGLLWRARQRCALAHCLLPESPSPNPYPPLGESAARARLPMAGQPPALAQAHAAGLAAARVVAQAQAQAQRGEAPLASARYVDHALPALFRLLEIDRGAYGELEAVLVGGARLAKLGRGAAGQIGPHNLEAARARLAAAGIRIVLEQAGGERGWQIMLDAGRMLYSAREIAGPRIV